MHSLEMKVSDVGEFGLINRIQKILPTIRDENVLLGIGDDTAVIKIDENRVQLLTCDIQVEDQHFQLDQISPYQLGRRAMAVNLSDIAAMGGTPRYALISLGIPPSFPLSDFETLIQGMREQLDEFSAHVIGGNLSGTSEKLVIDITLIGEARHNRFLTRSGARVRDRIFVTGTLGASSAGYYLLKKFGLQYPEKFEQLVQSHLQPIPRIELGRQIAATGMATAMIDISDGLASDLNHICQMSGVGAELYQSQIPVIEHSIEIEKITGKSFQDLMLHASEDYELLFTLKKDANINLIKKISTQYNLAITEIGRIVTKSEGYHLITQNKEKIPIKPTGWDHFLQ